MKTIRFIAEVEITTTRLVTISLEAANPVHAAKVAREAVLERYGKVAARQATVKNIDVAQVH